MPLNLANRVNSHSRTGCAKSSGGWCSGRPSICIVAYHPFYFRLEDSGITPRTLGVYFKDLRVVGTGASAFFQSTVGSKFNPKAAYNDIRRALRPETRDILSGFSGVVRPGEMLRKSPSLSWAGRNLDTRHSRPWESWIRMHHLPQDACQPPGDVSRRTG